MHTQPRFSQPPLRASDLRSRTTHLQATSPPGAFRPSRLVGDAACSMSPGSVLSFSVPAPGGGALDDEAALTLLPSSPDAPQYTCRPIKRAPAAWTVLCRPTWTCVLFCWCLFGRDPPPSRAARADPKPAWLIRRLPRRESSGATGSQAQGLHEKVANAEVRANKL